MEIIKNKRHGKCNKCLRVIEGKYKVDFQKNYYHLSCFFEHASYRLEVWKGYLKKLNTPSMKKHRVIEKLK